MVKCVGPSQAEFKLWLLHLLSVPCANYLIFFSVIQSDYIEDMSATPDYGTIVLLLSLNFNLILSSSLYLN